MYLNVEVGRVDETVFRLTENCQVDDVTADDVTVDDVTLGLIDD